MPLAYYNENDPKAAEWLRQLIAGNYIAPGEVDERNIKDVRPADLTGYDQHHFFAGIGGWSYALRLAGWPDDRPVWTGSCPCQPFSQAGAGKGVDDERHLWPVWRWLIDQCRPISIFGEQVASKDGREWLSGVRTDLDLLGYGVGAADLCAAGVGAPHIRQRLYWVGKPNSPGRQQGKQATEAARHRNTTEPTGSAGRLGNSVRKGLSPGSHEQARFAATNCWANSVKITCGDGKNRRIEPGLEPLASGIFGRVGLLRGYGNAIVPQVAAIFIESVMEKHYETTNL